MIIEDKDKGGEACYGPESQSKGRKKRCVTPALNLNFKNTKEQEKKQGVIGGKRACWDEWLYLEKPDAA